MVWPQYWIFKVKYRICYISTKSDPKVRCKDLLDSDRADFGCWRAIDSSCLWQWWSTLVDWRVTRVTSRCWHALHSSCLWQWWSTLVDWRVTRVTSRCWHALDSSRWLYAFSHDIVVLSVVRVTSRCWHALDSSRWLYPFSHDIVVLSVVRLLQRPMLPTLVKSAITRRRDLS